MNDDRAELIESLLVTAASIMEDTSSGILLKGDQKLSERVEAAKAASRLIAILCEAAKLLHQLDQPWR